MGRFDFEEERIEREIKRYGSKRVLIQLPEGLKQHGLALTKAVEKTGALAILSGEPCFGACDLPLCEAESLGVDLIVHYGHTRLLKHERIPTIYIEARDTTRVDAAVRKAIPLLECWKEIGLATTIQHVQMLGAAKEILLQVGKTVVIGDTGQMSYPGQVTGCDYSNAQSVSSEVEAFLFIGGGRFHALGLALSTSKPTIIADPYESRALSIGEEVRRTIRQRWMCIEEAKKARRVGVIIGLKPGQKHLETALRIKEDLEKIGKQAHLLAVRNLSSEILLNLPKTDAYVNTMCPRLSLDYTSRFHKPLLGIQEVSVITGKRSWEDLCREGWFQS